MIGGKNIHYCIYIYLNSSMLPSSQVRPIDGSIVENLLALEFGVRDFSFGDFDRGKRAATILALA